MVGAPGSAAIALAGVRLEHLPELEADAQRRVQRRGRVLRDIRHNRAAQPSQLLVAEREDVAAAEEHGPACDRQATPGMAKQRQADSGLAGTGFAYHPEYLAGADLERDVGHHRHPIGLNHDLQVGDGDGGLGRLGPLARDSGRVHSAPRLRSMPAAVRAMPSPIRPVPIVSSAMAMIGATAPHGWTASTSWFCWIMVPQFAPLGSADSPR